MSKRSQLFSDVQPASGRPYAERAEDDPGWHDRLATGLYAATLAPWVSALSRVRNDMQRIAAATDSHGAALLHLSDDALRLRAAALRGRLRRSAMEFGSVAECFAIVSEAAARTLGMRHHPTQVMAGYAMLRGRLVEMATGEGKTFCATLPVCAVALAGFPVHVITVNDYLARRDAENMLPLYRFFGLGVGTVVQGMERDQRRLEYAQAITYCTNKELAFDYLRDRVAPMGRSSRLHQALLRLREPARAGADLVLRGLVYAIVDEADSVLVDEARTPLVLSAQAPTGDELDTSRAALDFARGLTVALHFAVKPAEHSTTLTDAGRAVLDAFSAGRSGTWTSVRAREALVAQALGALHLYHRDQQYVVAADKVQIVDESTGRVMPDRSWERGLHQLIEIKEAVTPTPPRETLARLTYQRLFRRYVHLCGMTGTAAEAAAEIKAVYGLDLARVPLHRPSRRQHTGVRFYRTQQEKWQRVAAVVHDLALGAGRPVLIGTRSVQASEQISAVLQQQGIAHVLLNAKQDANEAEVIATAGLPGRVTVATNMAGRGTDIELGEGVAARGGLHVILTEYHDSKRVDRQLIGRCARQGDPGSCEVIVSLEDEIFALHAPALARHLRQAMTGGAQVPQAVLGALRAWAQWSAERRNALVRMQNMKFDRQLNKQLAFTGKSE